MSCLGPCGPMPRFPFEFGPAHQGFGPCPGGFPPGHHGFGRHSMRPGHHGFCPSHHRFGPVHYGFGPGHHGFGPRRHGFGPGHHGFGPGSHEFGSGFQGFGPSHHGCPPGPLGHHGSQGDHSKGHKPCHFDFRRFGHKCNCGKHCDCDVIVEKEELLSIIEALAFRTTTTPAEEATIPEADAPTAPVEGQTSQHTK